MAAWIQFAGYPSLDHVVRPENNTPLTHRHAAHAGIQKKLGGDRGSRRGFSGQAGEGRPPSAVTPAQAGVQCPKDRIPACEAVSPFVIVFCFSLARNPFDYDYDNRCAALH